MYIINPYSCWATTKSPSQLLRERIEEEELLARLMVESRRENLQENQATVVIAAPGGSPYVPVTPTTTTTTTTTPTTTTTTTTTSTTTAAPPTTTTTTTNTTTPAPPPGDYFIAVRLTNPSLSCNATLPAFQTMVTNVTTLDETTVDLTHTNYEITTIAPGATATLALIGVADAFFSVGPAPGGEWQNTGLSVLFYKYSDGGSPPCDVSTLVGPTWTYESIYSDALASGTAGTIEDPYIITVPTT